MRACSYNFLIDKLRPSYVSLTARLNDTVIKHGSTASQSSDVKVKKKINLTWNE